MFRIVGRDGEVIDAPAAEQIKPAIGSSPPGRYHVDEIGAGETRMSTFVACGSQSACGCSGSSISELLGIGQQPRSESCQICSAEKDRHSRTVLARAVSRSAKNLKNFLQGQGHPVSSVSRGLPDRIFAGFNSFRLSGVQPDSKVTATS
jgi:hypothetical protein